MHIPLHLIWMCNFCSYTQLGIHIAVASLQKLKHIYI